MRTVLFILAIVWMTLSGCESDVTSQSRPQFERGKRLSELTDEKLKEVSGLAASVRNPGFLWTLTDSGNEAKYTLSTII